MGHGWEGVVLKMFRGQDYVFTVTGAEDVTERYRRVHLTDGGLLAAHGTHPTMWVRLWFDNAGKAHQRAFTLVDPDAAAGTFSIEFSLHDGPASHWARTVLAGETIEATVQGTGFAPPDPAPSQLFVVGDPASLPAIDSLLAALPEVPATIWFEETHEADAKLTSRLDARLHDLRRVRRADAGARLAALVADELPELLVATPAPFVWIACDARTTRRLVALTKTLGVPKHRVKSLGYWRP